MPYYVANNTLTHIHHKIPTHVYGGVANNDPTNLVELTVPEHAEEHRKLYEQYGREEDRIAWQVLAGLIGKEDANRLACAAAQRRPEVRAKISKSLMGNRRGVGKNLGNKFASVNKGKPKSPETRAKMKAWRTGTKRVYNLDGSWHYEKKSNLNAVPW